MKLLLVYITWLIHMVDVEGIPRADLLLAECVTIRQTTTFVWNMLVKCASTKRCHLACNSGQNAICHSLLIITGWAMLTQEVTHEYP